MTSLNHSLKGFFQVRNDTSYDLFFFLDQITQGKVYIQKEYLS